MSHNNGWPPNHRHKHVIPETDAERATRQRLLAEYVARRKVIDEALAAVMVRRVEVVAERENV